MIAHRHLLRYSELRNSSEHTANMRARTATSRRVADQDFACAEENPGRSPNESQWQIPFHAGASDGWAESATPEEPGIVEVSPPQTWGGLVSRRVERREFSWRGF